MVVSHNSQIVCHNISGTWRFSIDYGRSTNDAFNCTVWTGRFYFCCCCGFCGRLSVCVYVSMHSVETSISNGFLIPLFFFFFFFAIFDSQRQLTFSISNFSSIIFFLSVFAPQFVNDICCGFVSESTHRQNLKSPSNILCSKRTECWAR